MPAPIASPSIRTEENFASPEVSSLSRLKQGLAEMAIQDWCVLGYHFLLTLALLLGDRAGNWQRASFESFLIFLWVGAALFLVRGRFLGPRAEGLLYRLTLVSTVEITYFMFRRLLPIINTRAFDEQLYELDLQLFGFEPAFALQNWISSALTEWFSFFYFGYFFLLAIHVLPLVFCSRDRLLQYEFTLGVLLTFIVGHLLYMVVPGFGPGVAMADQFTVDFPSGPWFDTMSQTVEKGGAQKDIFPSIHTAIPTFITLWSYRQRHRIPYRYSWPFVAVFSLNIILATMYLRWHYLIDVVIGFALGCSALWISIRLCRRDQARRQRLGLRPVWPDYPYFS